MLGYFPDVLGIYLKSILRIMSCHWRPLWLDASVLLVIVVGVRLRNKTESVGNRKIIIEAKCITVYCRQAGKGGVQGRIGGRCDSPGIQPRRIHNAITKGTGKVCGRVPNQSHDSAKLKGMLTMVPAKVIGKRIYGTLELVAAGDRSGLII